MASAPMASASAPTAPPATAPPDKPAEATRPARVPLTCRRPWDCVADGDLVGMTVAEVERELGKPYYDGGDRLSYGYPASGCGQPSQMLRLWRSKGKVTRVGFEWSLGDQSCLAEARKVAEPDKRPIDLRCAGPRSQSCPGAKALRGLDEVRVIEGIGFPHYAAAGRWEYFYPRHCSNRRATLTLTMRSGRVAAVSYRSKHTGEHCTFDF